MISNIMYPYKEHIKYSHTDSLISDKLLDDIKIGNNIGDLVLEGFYENCKIENCRSITGEFTKL